MMTIDLSQILGRRSQHEDGELILHHCNPWTLYALAGQPFYATDKAHPVRRWDRVLRQQGSTWNWELEAPHFQGSPCWECELMDWGISQGKLSLIRAKLMIRSVIQECLLAHV